MDSFYAPESDIIQQICLGESGNLLELFTLRTNRWRYPYMICGFLTIGIFDDLINCLTPERAFILIEEATAVLFKQSDLELITTALSLLTELARASETTEMPGPLQQQWPAISNHIQPHLDDMGMRVDWDSLCRWYRISEV